MPDADLAYVSEGSTVFDDYVEAVAWAQDYALLNRSEMMRLVLEALAKSAPPFQLDGEAINCHHNYIAQEKHGSEELYVTRKGAISAGWASGASSRAAWARAALSCAARAIRSRCVHARMAPGAA